MTFRARIFVCTALAVAAGGARAADVDLAKLPKPADAKIDFLKDVQPIFAKSCTACHGPEKQKSGYRLDARAYALKGGEIGKSILPGDSAHSPLIHYVAGAHDEITMPPKGDRLTPAQVATLRAWIDQGAHWPADADQIKVVDKADWWSLKPIARPAVPPIADPRAQTANPIDHFVLAKLDEQHLRPARQADRRTLIRRLYFDLTGLPPTPEEVEAFINDPDPDAYDKLVDKLLASPRYGEKWGRHWLDVVHYGDTHGYDKDKVRPNAWPYRDYVIRAFNDDKPYDRFVKEQLAGDALYPNTPDGVVALGFIAAGPWDFVGQVELREGTIDKQITRNLDRDDMVQVAMNTFVSLTAQCARCHNHKFDPILQEDYYSLQAVFAGVDRADRPYETDATIAAKRHEIQQKLAATAARTKELQKAALAAAGPELASLDERLNALAPPKNAPGKELMEFGYHSKIMPRPDSPKWVQIDLGAATPIERILVVGAHDTFNGIGAGFGFPPRYKIEASDDPAFARDVTTIVDRTGADFANPGVRPQAFAAPAGKVAARYVRLTATKLAARADDYILALGEMSVITPDGKNAALGKAVTALDTVDVPPRWRRANLVDGRYYGQTTAADPLAVAKLTAERDALIARAVSPAVRAEMAKIEADTKLLTGQLNALPASGLVYAARPIPKPRPIHLLNRGSEKQPRQEVGPGAVTLAYAPDLPARFATPPDAPNEEALRRAALAQWIVSPKNPLAWRSIVNRIWQYHFGRGIVESANDFGHMGATPTHPELLDYLAAEFRDGGEHLRANSIKGLTRLIVTSRTYRQSCDVDPDNARIDGGNQYLWRMNRAKLDAEVLRDSILSVAGKLDPTMGGPGFMLFGFKDDHSPHYAYAEHDPDDPKSLRRSVYRMVVRSVPDPFMETLDCADPSQIVPKRNETLTALQALALLNNKFVVRMAEHFAARVEQIGPDTPAHIDAACRLAYGRPPTDLERRVLTEIAEKHGLPNACRLILNSNEFVFVD